jgi:hypothetical protein
VATRFDRVIPPGGKGTVTITVDNSRIRGEFKKKAVLWSNDPRQSRSVVYLEGEVNPRISLEPGGYVSLAGVLGGVPPEQLDIINRQKEPVRILDITTDLGGRIRWEVDVMEPGYAYRLRVEDASSKPGEYFGHLYIRTDAPKKPELVVILNGRIREKSS